MRYAGCVSVVHRPLPAPGAEDRLHGGLELLHRVGGESGGDGAELGDDLLQGFHTELGVGGHVVCGPMLRQHLLEIVVGDAENHRAEHLHEAAIGVVDEAGVGRECHHAASNLIVEPDVEDGVHHPRHRELRTRATRNQQGIGGIPEALPGLGLDPLESGRDLVPRSLGEGLAGIEVGEAGFGRHRETGWNRDSDPGHLAEVGSLAAEETPHALPVAADPLLGVGDLFEAVDPLHDASLVRLHIVGPARVGPAGDRPIFWGRWSLTSQGPPSGPQSSSSVKVARTTVP